MNFIPIYDDAPYFLSQEKGQGKRERVEKKLYYPRPCNFLWCLLLVSSFSHVVVILRTPETVDLRLKWNRTEQKKGKRSQSPKIPKLTTPHTLHRPRDEVPASSRFPPPPWTCDSHNCTRRASWRTIRVRSLTEQTDR